MQQPLSFRAKNLGINGKAYAYLDVATLLIRERPIQQTRFSLHEAVRHML